MRNRKAAAALALASLLPAAATASGGEGKKAEPHYEMTTYQVGFLRKGPAWTAEVTPETRALQQGHMANIRKMADAGKLLLAGPFTDGGDLRGMFVFRVATVEEAKALVAEDPAVQAGRLVVDFHPWLSARGIRVDPDPPPAAKDPPPAPAPTR